MRAVKARKDIVCGNARRGLEEPLGNPLAAVFPTLKVDSVAAYEEKIKGLGGSVLIPSNICPCTGAPFAVCVDVSGNQFMIKQPRD